jgi:ribosomal protein L44E
MRHRPEVHKCSCPTCREHPRAVVAREHRTINRLVAAADERLRRLLVGFFARQRGPGGIAELERITGIDRNTIAKGQRELSQAKPRFPGRIRPPGAGRKRVEEKRPGC